MEYLPGRVDAEYRVTMSWDFKAKLLSDEPPQFLYDDGDNLVPVPVPLTGVWSLRVDSHGDDLVFDISHGTLAYAALGDRLTVAGEFAYVAGPDLQQIHTTKWTVRSGPQPSLSSDGSPYDCFSVTHSKRKLAENNELPHAIQNRTQQDRFSFTLTQEPRKAPEPKPDLSKALMSLSNFAHSPTRDVRLLFKRSADNLELELWTDADFLAKASEYYKTLFASGSLETVVKSRKKRQRAAVPTVAIEQKQLPAPGATPAADLSVDWQDSDDETDAFLVERDWMNCTTTKQDTAEFDYQEIEVHETAYSTMCAVLLYLQTGHIKFAPLRSLSSHGLSPDELTKKRNASLTKSLEEQPTLPPAVSPKSVYRLAHLLERNNLQQKALDALASSLTILGAADELFSPVSVAYDQNWDEVKATEAWRAVRNNVARGHGQAAAEGAAQILFDLLAAINDN